MEQLNIVGKRSGEGFVAHKAMLVIALARAIADRVTLMGVTLGRKGFIGYLKALGGSNIVKVIPSNGSASGKQATGKGLKVLCGANTSYLDDSLWIQEATAKKQGTPFTFCEVRVSPSNSVTPNVGAIELAEALARVLPFTAKGKEGSLRPALACVSLEAKDGKLTLVGADGFRLAVISLDYADGEGQALIKRDELIGVVSALRKAKRVRITFEEGGGKKLTSRSLIIDTELIRYKWVSLDGNYPDWQKLIPTEFKVFAHFDTVEAIKAVNSLKALFSGMGIDIRLDDSGMLLSTPDEPFGQAFIPAEVEGSDSPYIKVRLDGQYLAEALKACGGMVELKLTNALSPMLFSADGYQLVLMPMITPEAQKQAEKAEPKAEPLAEPVAEQAEPVAVPVAPVAEAKQAKRNRAKQPIKVK